MGRPDKVRTESGKEFLTSSNEGTSARTRPFTMDDIMRRREMRKPITTTETVDTKMTLDVRSGESASNLSGSVAGKHTDSSENVEKLNLFDFQRNDSNRAKEMVQDGSFNVKRKEILHTDPSLKETSHKERGNDRGHTDENRSHCQIEEHRGLRSRTDAEKPRNQDVRLKSMIGDKGRNPEREDNRESKRRHRSEQRANVDRKMEVEGNDIKKHASHRRSDESYYDRKDRKKASSKIGQEVNREESRSKRRRSSSRERRNHQRTKNRSLSTSPKEHKRTSYHDREYEDPSHHAYKEKHVSKHHEVDKNRRNNSGSGTLYRRYGDSGIGGYSPRKRRTEAAVRTPSPTLRSPERRSAAWDVKPVGAEVAASIPTLALLTPSQMSLLNGHEVPAVSPVISTAPNPYPASITIALTSVGNNASEDAVQLTQATRPSRRLYVENIPASISDKELIECFNKFLSSSGSNHVQGRQPCISCMVNREKKQALLEFLAPEDATRALSFEGNSFGGAVLRMKRPKDFVESANGALDKVGPNVDSISDNVKDSPHKIFIGGIAKTLSPDMLKEVVTAFGHLKAYHFEGQEFGLSCAFLEFSDQSVTQRACVGLNGMKLGGHVIAVVQASPDASGEETSSGSPVYVVPEHAKPLLEDPTPVLKLTNMFSEEDFGFLSEPDLEETLEDVRLECVRFGGVKSLNIVGRTKNRNAGVDAPAVSGNGVTENLVLQPIGNVEIPQSMNDEHGRVDGVIVGAIVEVPDDCVGEQGNQGHKEDKPAPDPATMEPTSFDPEYENNKSINSNAVLEIHRSPRDASSESNSLIADRNAKIDSSESDMVYTGVLQVPNPENNNESQKESGEEERLMKNCSELEEALTDINEDHKDNSDATQIQEATAGAITLDPGTSEEPVEPTEAEETWPPKMEHIEDPLRPDSDSPIFEPGTIFVEFTRKEGACLAAHSLHGRLFGGHTVMTGYVPLHLYRARFPR